MGRTTVISVQATSSKTVPGKATGKGAHNADASVLPMEGRAGRNHSDHSEQSAEEARSDDVEADDDDQNG